MRSVKLLAGLLLLAGAVLAAVPATAADTGAMKQVGMVRTGSGSFSIDVEGAEIHAVLRAIAEFSGRNIVVAKDIKGAVRVSLHNVAWQDALRTVLRANDLDYVDENGIIRVDEGSRLAAEMVERETARAKASEMVPLETRVVKLNYANALELTAALTGTLTKRGSILVEKRTNSLIISDLPDQVTQVEKMAISLDTATPQIEITAKLVDVDTEALRDIGIEWNIAPGLTKSPEEPEFWRGVDDGDGKVLAGGGALHNGDRSLQMGGEHNTSISDAANKLTFGIFKDWGSIEAQLQTLEQSRKARIISNPRVTTVDNREAKILVGQKIPLIIQDVAGNPLTQLQTIGIQLKVTPHLTADHKVVMDLHPEVSDLSTQSTVQGGVIINTSEADTRVMVDDGQTAVIGGLIRTNDGTIRRGVPYLKDIPLLGILFRSNSEASTSRELLIFVTPRITNLTAVETGH
jgi:type IV pilus assembly protein PilQ